MKHHFDYAEMEKAIAAFLEKGLGIDLTDDNFAGTPKRVARSFAEMCHGLIAAEDVIEDCLRKAFPSNSPNKRFYNGIIFSPDVVSFSVCPHHLLPVEYITSIGYIPNKEAGKVIGASKLSRIVNILSQRPVLQETLTMDIVEILENSINPQGIAIVMSGKHGCMRCRGVKQNTSFETSYMTGSFKDNIETREEFFHLLSIAQRNKR